MREGVRSMIIDSAAKIRIYFIDIYVYTTCFSWIGVLRYLNENLKKHHSGVAYSFGW
jgi:hypothetical protein